MKDERFVYIKNPMLSKQIKLNQTLKNFKSTSSIVDCLKSGGTKYYGKLKWEDGAELKAKFPLYNQTTDSTELEEPKETEQIAVEVTGIALFDNKPLRYTFGGEYKNNKPHGYGLLSHSGGIFEGKWAGRNMKGIGEEVWNDETFYRGEFDKGMKNGIGIYRWPDGTIYQGEWVNNEMNGYGIIIYTDDRVYEGEITNGTMDGLGKFSWPDGKFYFGQYENDFKNGFGVFVWDSINIEAYVGFWYQGKPDGPGIKIKGNVEKYGLWKKGNKKKWLEGIWEIKEMLNEDQLPYFIFLQKAVPFINYWKKKF